MSGVSSQFPLIPSYSNDTLVSCILLFFGDNKVPNFYDIALEDV